MKTLSCAAAAALIAGGAAANTVVFDESLVVVLASAAATQSFSAANGNLPDGDRVSIDQSTSDYGIVGSGASHGLLRFSDFALPAGATVTAATLEFFTKSFSDGPVSVHQLLTGFDTTTTWLGFGGNGVTPGVEAAATPLDSATDLADESPIAFDVTAAVADWAAGAPAYGFALLNASGDGWDFQVLADGAEFSPRLTVDYATSAVVPLPAGGALLVSALAGLATLRRARR
jgi:hypothetical protein